MSRNISDSLQKLEIDSIDSYFECVTACSLSGEEVECITRCVEVHLKGEDVSWLVPHQANLRIIDATARRMEVDASKVMVNIHKYGNTTAASIPIALCESISNNQLNKGDILVLAAFGSGFSWGSAILKW